MAVDTEKLKTILQADMNRKEFLSYIGIALLGVVGITTFLKNLENTLPQANASTPAVKQPSGYGASPYGR